MRPLEILLLLILLVYLLWLVLPMPRPRWRHWLVVAAVVVLLLHFSLEGGRWQMLPAYIVTAMLLVLALYYLGSLDEERPGWWILGPLAALGFLGWLASAVLAFALPVPEVPQPTGPYTVGTRIVHLTDEERPEIYSDDPDDRRRLTVQFWYPAAPTGFEPRAPFINNLDQIARTLAERLGLPSFLLNHLNLIRTASYVDAPLAPAAAPAPVLLFSHGLRGIRVQNLSTMQELASHGYVVAAIDHTYANAISIFPDGSTVLYDPDVLSGTGEPPRTAKTLVEVWAADQAFVLDRLAGWAANPDDPFFEGPDLDRVGTFGHSTGGGTAVEFCGTDDRCDAAAGLDPWLVPISDAVAQDGLDEPLLILKAPAWEFEDAAENDARVGALVARSAPGSDVLVFPGTLHFDFSDIPLLSPFTAQLGLTGPVDGRETVLLQQQYLLNFFDSVLRR